MNQEKYSRLTLFPSEVGGWGVLGYAGKEYAGAGPCVLSPRRPPSMIVYTKLVLDPVRQNYSLSFSAAPRFHLLPKDDSCYDSVHESS